MDELSNTKNQLNLPSNFILKVKHLPNVELMQNEKGEVVSWPPIEVIEGPDGEIGIPANIAVLANFGDGELISAGFDENKSFYLTKIINNQNV